MQPNDQQGYVQPDQNQPVQPVAPPQPAPVEPQQPVQPIQQFQSNTQPQVDPAALQEALAEPTTVTPAPQPQQLPQPPLEQSETDEEYEDEDQLSDQSVTWVAHEYIHQEKGTLWFIIFAVIIAALLGISIWTQAWSFTVLIAVIAFVVVVYSRRPPRELSYALNDDGLTIDQTLHEFGKFKSFGIIRDGEEFSVMLIPTQRFQPGVTVYFPEEAGEDIVDLLGSRLPMRDLHLDAVDRVVRLLRL